MSKLPIVFYPDPILKKQTAPVSSFDAALGRFLDDMKETMYAERGIGLAAPQVGSLQRVTVIDVSDDGDSPIELINPQIVSRSGKTSSEEGCLSIPEYREHVERSKSVVVRANDRTGAQFELEADELLAICLQHEIDHLDGVLFVDRLSRLKRDYFLKWFKKQSFSE